VTLDRLAHWAYAHHLIPRSWLGWACDRYDRQLGVTEPEMRSTR